LDLTQTLEPGKINGEDDSSFFSAGDSFGKRYRIIEEIGRGGMGKVYKAEDLELGVTVALKLIKPKYSQNEKFIQRFKTETLLARSISHENIIRIHDIGEVEDVKFISMDYIRGQNLNELIHTSKNLTVKTAVDITRQICQALIAAHEKGIVHRDLKPSNIMIDMNGKAYVMDFGLAKIQKIDELDKSGKIAGTPSYMSPEQARGKILDRGTDIYSLGIILFKMLTGKKVFEADSKFEYMQKHIHESPPSPSQFNPQISPQLEKIILKCLEKDKAKRYSSARSLLEDLDKQRAKIVLEPPKIYEKKVFKYAGLSVLVIFCAIAFFILFGRKETPSSSVSGIKTRSVAVMPIENKTGDIDVEKWGRSVQNLLISDLRQSIYLRVLPEERLLQLLESENSQENKESMDEIMSRIVNEEDIEYFVLSEVTKKAGKFIITLRIHVMKTGQFIDPAITEELNEKHSGMVDKMTLQIKSILRFSSSEIQSDIDRNVQEISTSSLQAWNYFVEGRRYIYERKTKEGIQFLKTALDLDPGFAMAHIVLSVAYGLENRMEERNNSLKKAAEFIDRVSLRDRYLILGKIASQIDKSTIKAIENYQKLVDIYPDDGEGIVYLAAVYRFREEWDLAMNWYSILLKIQDKTYRTLAIDNMAVIYVSQDLCKKGLELLNKNQTTFSNQNFFYRLKGTLLMSQGRYEEALTDINQALFYEPDDPHNLRLLGNIYHLKDDFIEAEKAYRLLIQSEEIDVQLDGLFWLAKLYLSQGRLKESLEKVELGLKLAHEYELPASDLKFHLFSGYLKFRLGLLKEAYNAVLEAQDIAQRASSIDGPVLSLHLSGIILSALRDTDKAEQTAEDILDLIELTSLKKNKRYYYHLSGSIDLQKGKTLSAVDNLSQAFLLLPDQTYIDDMHAFFLEPLARAYYESGNWEKAQESYEKITELAAGRIAWGDIFARSFYWLGKIHQANGNVLKAVESYEKFMLLWQTADPSLPEISDAEKQLKTLQESQQN